MNRAFKIGGGALLIGATAYVVLPQLNKGDVFIPGDQPVNRASPAEAAIGRLVGRGGAAKGTLHRRGRLEERRTGQVPGRRPNRSPSHLG